MITSRLANVIIATFGLVFIGVAVAMAIQSMLVHEPDSLGAVVLSAALGFWFLVGGINNIRRGPQTAESSKTYVAAKWNTVAILVLLPACVVMHIYKDELLRRSGFVSHLGAVVCTGFAISVCAAPFVLLCHVVAKAADREAAKTIRKQAA